MDTYVFLCVIFRIILGLSVEAYACEGGGGWRLALNYYQNHGIINNRMIRQLDSALLRAQALLFEGESNLFKLMCYVTNYCYAKDK